MPRAIDPKPLLANNDPNRSGTEFHIGSFQQIDQLIEQILDGLLNSFELLIIPAIEDLLGIDLSAVKPLLDQLDLDCSSPEAFLTSIVNTIVALPELLITLVISLIESLISSVGDDSMPDLVTGIIDLILSLPELLFNLATELLDAGAGLLGIDSALDSLNLFNLIPTDLFGQVDISHIGSSVTNLLTDPNFLDTAALSGIPGWIHDLTGGFGGAGSMSVVANGTTHELFGNLIGVSKDQVMPISGRAKWTGLAGTGSPIALGVTGYLNGAATTQTTVASHNTTPATTDWLTLSGTYTVPANVDSIRTRLIVGPTATAGTVGFSTLKATKTGPMLQRLIGGTDAGTLLPDDISNLFGGIITNTVDILDRVLQGDFEDLLGVLGGSWGTDFADIEDRLDDFLHSLSPLNGSNVASGSVADDFLPGVTTTLNNIFGGLFGLGSVTGATHDDAASALQANAHALVDHGAGITNMFARLSNLESRVSALPVAGGGTGVGTADGGAIGVIDTDSFERFSPTDLGPTWTQVYAGGAGVWATPNGHDATWVGSGVDDRDFLAIRNNPTIPRSQTDYQRVTVELSSRGERFNDPLLGIFDFVSFNDIWLRISDATTSLANITGIRIRWGSDGSLSIHRFLAGAGFQLAHLGAGGIVPPGPGANLIGEAGVLVDGAPRVFRAKIGGSIRLAVTETGTSSGLGATFRRWGHGGRAEGHLLPLPGQEAPGGAHYINLMDQTL